MTEPRISLAERLRTERQERGISQSQAARELEVARTAYRLWELEAARPAPDRWRLVARWLGVSINTLLLAEGLISEEEADSQEEAADRYETPMGATSDLQAGQESGDFFEQAHAVIDGSIERGVLSADEARQFRAMFRRVEDALRGRRSRPTLRSVPEDRSAP